MIKQAIDYGMIPSLAGSAAIMLALLALLYWRHVRRGVPLPDAGCADPIGIHLASGGARDRTGSLLIAILWLLLSTSITFLAPRDKGSYLLDRVQMVTAINFCLAVPLLVGCYVALLRSEARLFGHAEDAPKRRGAGFWALQLVLVALALFIQFRATVSEIELPAPCSPWVEVPGLWQGQSNELHCVLMRAGKDEPARKPEMTISLSPPPGVSVTTTVVNHAPAPPPAAGNAGVASAKAVMQAILSQKAVRMEPAGNIYFVLRGLDTLLALGLFATLASIGWRSGRGSIARRIHDARRRLTTSDYQGLRPTDAALNFGTALVIAIMLGSIIAALQGISLMAHGARIGDEGFKMRLIVESTWILWVVLTLIGSLLAASTILNLRACIVAEIGERYRAELEALPAPPDAATSEAIAERYRKAPAWPFPAGVLPAIGFATFAQIGNLVLALYTFSAG